MCADRRFDINVQHISVKGGAGAGLLIALVVASVAESLPPLRWPLAGAVVIGVVVAGLLIWRRRSGLPPNPPPGTGSVLADITPASPSLLPADHHPCYRPHGSAHGDPNAPGDFHVVADCCTLCGVTWRRAPEFFNYDDVQCWVSRQPQTAAERARLIAVLEVQDLGCVKYRGADPDVVAAINRLA